MKKMGWFFLSIALLILTACGATSGGGGGGGDVDPAVCGGESKGCITGSVTDSTGAKIEGANIEITLVPLTSAQIIKASSGELIATANEEGWYTAEGIDEGERTICYSATGYFEVCRNVMIIATSTTTITPTALVARGDPVEVEDVESGVAPPAVKSSTGAQIKFNEANSVCDASGNPIEGDVDCYMTPIDVTADEGGLALAPSTFQATRIDGSTGMMISSAMVAISCESSGVEVQICENKTVEVHIPIYGDVDACNNNDTNPGTLPSWRYDDATGGWIEFDTGSLTKVCGGTPPGEAGANQYYSGNIDHLGWINADDFVSSTCLSGTVTGAAGGASALVTVRCHGSGWQNESYTSSPGMFCVPAPVSRTFTCTAGDAYRWLGVDDYKTGTASDLVVEFPLVSCPADGCTDIGDFAFDAPILTTTLTWGVSPDDLDSHFVPEGGDQIFFGNKGLAKLLGIEKGSLTSSPYISLDTDDTSSYGPEVVTAMRSVADGTYRFCVRNFSGESDGSLCSSGAEVRVNIPGTVSEVREVPTSCPSGENLLWQVYEITISGGDVNTYNAIDRIVESESERSAAVDCY